jgi:membrane fusion protein (multidrug efflux system)
MRRILTLTALAAALTIVFSGLCGCQRSEKTAAAAEKQDQTRAVPVEVMEVRPVDIRDVLELPGEAEAWQDVRVAADASGRVEWIGPHEGDRVAKQALIAKIDVSTLKAALDRAQAAFNLADECYRRRQRLYERRIITEEELDQSRTELLVAKADLQQARVSYEHGFVRSPIDGIINHLHVDEGEFVETGKPLADMVNIERIRINVQVPELDVRFLQEGAQTPVHFDALPENQFIGTIAFVAYKADPATKTFLVRTVIENPAQKVRPGMIARVNFLRQTIPDALAVPLFAIVERGGERLLYVEENGVAKARTVTIGVIDESRVQITSGLEAGERLIVKGQTEVEEGVPVRVQ